jgi:hypothetical protein
MRSPEMGMGAPEQKTPEQKQQMVTKLGSLLHEEWRAPRKKEDGSFEPRVKKTKDEAWKAAHGAEEVDIANTSFAELPADWQGENRAAAEVAMNEVFRAAEGGQNLDKSFVEKASATVHDKWLERNGAWAPEEQKKPFEELAEEEKEKDRTQVRKAIEIFESSK